MATAAQIRHRGPGQKRVLDGDVILLRKVNFAGIGPGFVERIGNTALRPGEYERDMPWFTEGYIAGEQPRDAMITNAIMQNTTGFAIARVDDGSIITSFNRNEAEKAERVTHSARVELAVDVALSQAEEDESNSDTDEVTSITAAKTTPPTDH